MARCRSRVPPRAPGSGYLCRRPRARSASTHARPHPLRRRPRHRRLSGRCRGRHQQRPALVLHRRPAAGRGEGGQGAGQRRAGQRRVRVPAPAHHRQPGPRRYTQGWLRVRPADRARHPGRQRAAPDQRSPTTRSSSARSASRATFARCAARSPWRSPPVRPDAGLSCCPAPTCPRPPSSRGSRSAEPAPCSRSAATSPATRPRSGYDRGPDCPHGGTGARCGRFRRRPEPGRRQAGARGRGGGRAQHPAHRPARSRQDHARPPAAHHPAVHEPRRGAGNHQDPQRRRNPAAGPVALRRAAVPGAAPHHQRRGPHRRRLQPAPGRGEPGPRRRAVPRRAARVPPQRARGAAPAAGGRRRHR